MTGKSSGWIQAFDGYLSKRHTGQYVYPVAGIIILIILWLILTKDLRLWVDIGFADEAKYLSNGINFFKHKAEPFWGPLYSLWYLVLHLFTSNPIDLYYLNYRLMTLLPCIGLYIFLLKMKVFPAASFYFSFAFLISLINLPTWPKVSHFTLTVILAGLIVIHQIKNKNTKLIAVFILSLIVTYMRPEFILATFIFLVVIIKRLIKNDFGIKRFALSIITAVVFLTLFGIPYSAGRNLTAFGQAYPKYIDISKKINNNGTVKDWQQILDQNFGDPKSITDAFINNNSGFLKHIEVNLTRLPHDFDAYIYTLFPDSIFPVNYTIKLIIILLILVTIFILFLLNKIVKYRERVYNSFIDKKEIIFFSTVLCLPPLVGILLYYPRSHYLLLLFPFVYLIISLIIAPLKFKSAVLNILTFIFIIVISFTLIPKLSNYYTKPEFRNLRLVNSINNLNITRHVNLLTNEVGLDTYLPSNYKSIQLESKTENFNKLISENNIGMIYTTFSLNTSSKLRNDSTWFEFLKDPDQFNFKKFKSNSIGTIFLRDDFKIKDK